MLLVAANNDDDNDDDYDFDSGGGAVETLLLKAWVTDMDVRRTWILFGDPTTKLK